MRLVDCESTHQHATDAVRSLHVLVLPRSLVTSGGGQHFDIVTEAQLFGEQAARVLRARGDLAPVSRGDQRELHAIAPWLFGADLSGRRSSTSTTGPVGNSSSTCAAGRSDRSRRATHPGIRSIRCVAAVDDSKANMSRYFRSITDQL